jgi:FkbM family methyltransferase
MATHHMIAPCKKGFEVASTMKQKLRAAIEAGLRRLPVARAAYAERDSLSERLVSTEAKLAEATAALAAKPYEVEVARFLKEAAPASRDRLFDAFAAVGGLSDYLYVETEQARFVVNARDQFISRGLFVSGSADYEKFKTTVDLLRRYKNIDGIDLLVDVGANLGSICIPAITDGFVKRAIAVEPHPTNCRLLRANIALNDLVDRIEVVARAASARDDEMLIMELSKDNWGDHRIFSSARIGGLYGETDRKKIEVQSVKIDSLYGLKGNPALLIWIDIQGYEGFALQGAQQLLAERPPLVLEFWPYGMLRSDSFSALCSSTLQYNGFLDLAKPTQPLRKMNELQSLFHEVGPAGEFTDILVI